VPKGPVDDAGTVFVIMFEYPDVQIALLVPRHARSEHDDVLGLGDVVRGDVVDFPDKVLKVGDVSLPIVGPMISRIDNQERPTGMGGVVDRPGITVLFVGDAAVWISRAGGGARFFEAVVANVGELEGEGGGRSGRAVDVFGEVGYDVRVEADVLVLSQERGEGDGLGHGGVISHEEDFVQSQAVHLCAQFVFGRDDDGTRRPHRLVPAVGGGRTVGFLGRGGEVSVGAAQIAVDGSLVLQRGRQIQIGRPGPDPGPQMTAILREELGGITGHDEPGEVVAGGR